MDKIIQNNLIGQNLKRLRLKNKLTQEQTVLKLQLMGIDISRGSYAKIEVGKRNIYVNELKALKEIFKGTYEEIFE